MKKSKVITAGLLSATMLASMLTGCGGEKKVEDKSTETSGEVVWWGWTPGSPANEEYIKEFNKEYPDIKVTWKQTTIDNYDAALDPP